jgi:predicted NAD/FAD-dependent oxidoreductase
MALRGMPDDLVARIDEATMAPILTALVGLPGPLGRSWDHIRFGGESLFEARRQSHLQPMGPEGWVLHGAPEFSRDNLECDPDAVAQHLWLRFRDSLDLSTPAPIYLRGHRWRFGRTETPLGQPCLFDGALGVGVCGDWCLGDNVEAALASGRALAARVLGIPERPLRRPLEAREEQA